MEVSPASTASEHPQKVSKSEKAILKYRCCFCSGRYIQLNHQSLYAHIDTQGDDGLPEDDLISDGEDEKKGSVTTGVNKVRPNTYEKMSAY